MLKASHANTPAIGISTPAILQGSPPWAVQTPEVSPMLWERCPPPKCGQDPGGNAAGGLSKELLRRVCEPFFEQMLVALQEVLTNPYAMVNHEEAFSSCFMQATGCQNERLSEEFNDEEDGGDLGAFSSVLVGNNWQGGGPSMETFDFQARASDVNSPVGDGGVKGEGEQGGEEKVAVVMVCRHWKSKGWCRMGDACKFSHPSHKCGVGSASKGSTAAPLARSNSSDEEGTGVDGPKKSGRKRRSKARGGKSLQQPGDQVENNMEAPVPQQEAIQHPVLQGSGGPPERGVTS